MRDYLIFFRYQGQRNLNCITLKAENILEARKKAMYAMPDVAIGNVREVKRGHGYA